MALPAHRLSDLLMAERPDRGAIAAHLDALDHAGRMEAIVALGGPKAQGRLWDAAAGTPPVALGDLVPPDAPPLREVIFHGKNSLPAFTLFQKRFCRPPAGQPADRLWGYNHQDRKSTRLNSSHTVISYAVFCLKKKKKTLSVFYLNKKKTKHNNKTKTN